MEAILSTQRSECGTGLSVFPGSRATGLEGLAVGSGPGDINWDMGNQLDFVPSSQPSQDGEEPFLMTPPHRLPHFGISHRSNATGVNSSASEGAAGHADGATGDVSTESSLRRARLIRRASPVKPSPATKDITPRCFNLVRRVTKGPSERLVRAAELEQKRQQARKKAQRVMKKIHALARATVRLRRKHRSLRAFVTAKSEEDKENIFWIQ
ncbi:hypothetical protein MVEN_00673900 [Mycena venus]|uniref:Uncharacterized protein n=1 Tax=Mycena venus TaxID=2733690 RepID=A0A8H6YR01_9AGAR|nr:hypothetical protein MVEN_00673900 [Mycena venus]